MLALHLNIRLGCKRLTVSNSLAYFTGKKIILEKKWQREIYIE
jgi:hypothetical protein